MNVTKSDVINAVKALGILPGDIVLVHSSMKSMGYVEGGPDTVIDGFLEVLGDTGTLVMPTLSQTDFANAYRDWHLDRPSDVGLLTEVFRKRSDAKRSDQATHSVAAIGKDAVGITEGHTAFGPRFGTFGSYAFSYSSPWQKMYDSRAKVVFVGVNMRYHTFRHFAEYRFVERLLKRIEGCPGYEEVRNKLRHFDDRGEYHVGVWPYMAGVRLHDEYIKAGFVTRANCGNAEYLCIPAYESVNFVEELMEKQMHDPNDDWMSEEFRNWVNEVEVLAATNGKAIASK